MLAASPAGMPTGLALPGGITVATASPAGAWPRDGFAGGRLMTEAWSGGVQGQFASRGGCRWRGGGPGPLPEPTSQQLAIGEVLALLAGAARGDS